MKWDWTFPDIISILTVFSFYLVAWWNYKTNKRRASSQEGVDVSGAMKSLNESIILASQRAQNAENRVALGEERESELEKRLAQLEKSLTYRIIFDVSLGSNPSIVRSEIFNNNDRRKESVEVESDRRAHLTK